MTNNCEMLRIVISQCFVYNLHDIIVKNLVMFLRGNLLALMHVCIATYWYAALCHV